MENFAPGNNWVTACARTCAVEWRRTCRPASLSAVMMPTVAPSTKGTFRSASAPSTMAARAAFARREPMDAAKSADVEPAGNSRADPSGSLTVSVDIGVEVYGETATGLSPFST